jgi:hypothetical protein
MAVPTGSFPPNERDVSTDSSNTVLFICDAPGDNTRRPRPANQPRYWPGREPPPEWTPSPEPPNDGS